MEKKTDFKEKPLLTGERAILRPFRIEDFEDMIAILSEPDLRKLTGSAINEEKCTEPFSEEDLHKMSAWYESRNEQTDRMDLAVIDRHTGDLVGEAVLNEYDEVTRNVNFRILIGKSGQGRGIGSEATQMLLKYAFEVLNLHKVSLEVFSFNPRAERVYVKSGFILEGVRREDFRFEEDYFDTKIYGILKSDYAQIGK